MMAALVPVALVVLAVVALVVVKASGGAGGTPAASKVAAGSSVATTAGTSALPSGVLANVTSVSPSTLSAIGEPSATVAPMATGAKTALNASNGKPEILFIGAEYCPYCAAERWSVVEAMSHFGTFSGQIITEWIIMTIGRTTRWIAIGVAISGTPAAAAAVTVDASGQRC